MLLRFLSIESIHLIRDSAWKRHYRDSTPRPFYRLYDLFRPRFHTRKGCTGGIRTTLVRNCEADRNGTHDRSIKVPTPRPTPCECLDYPALLLTSPSISADIQSPALLPRLTFMYRKSVPSGSNRQVKYQDRWLPPPALSGPSSIPPTGIAINSPRELAMRIRPWGGMLPM